MERIEPETEFHRTQKALKHLLQNPQNEDVFLFRNSQISINVSDRLLRTSGGQLTLALMVNLFLRMKTIISTVAVQVPSGIQILDTVPLGGTDLRDGLESLARSIVGDGSQFSVDLDLDGQIPNPTIVVAIGRDSLNHLKPDILVEADEWAAYVNCVDSLSNWDVVIPFGAQLAATLGVAEVFKHLLIRNYPEKAESLHIKPLRNSFLSALTYTDNIHQIPRSIREINFDNIAIVGVGAGGSAALYSLACLPKIYGTITLVEPGNHKKSNLSRYLLSSYHDCHNETSKLDVAQSFFARQQPQVKIEAQNLFYKDVIDRKFRLLVSTVDTAEARREIQDDWPPVILDAAVLQTIYAIFRVYPGVGMCLYCKHPYDPNITLLKRATTWGKEPEELEQLTLTKTPVTRNDIERLAYVQGQPIENFVDLVGVPFDVVPSLTECGVSQFNLQYPNQAASLPFVTTMAGIFLAAEIVKDQHYSEYKLKNWFEHNLLGVPKPKLYRFRPRYVSCPYCSNLPRV